MCVGFVQAISELTIAKLILIRGGRPEDIYPVGFSLGKSLTEYRM